MAVFKCKMCGGDLEINGSETVVKCEYCGTMQTLPKLSDERKANLFDRANHFRRNNEFDKAMGIYEQILNEDTTDAESYWSLVLCRYGIDYVEDPASHKRVPTVNRAQFTSVFDDEDYKSALQHADPIQRQIYEEEATAINEIQKGILAISQQEEPFDVFICYKETDNSGRRTQDSVIATELYHELTREGYKVFFSRITLEDKLGTAYEPYIFAALNSSKVMVVLGTRQEYFNAVWVKNEWSRYLSLIKNGAKKILIPAYRDMDPYDLPEEFSHLQAQDMSKLGFMQDLIRGINKLVKAEAPQPAAVKETVVQAGSTNIAPLLKRALMFLEDGDWNSANEYCEKVLDIDPECAEAYLGKLMADLRCRKQTDLKNCQEPFDANNNYQKVLRFADEQLKSTIAGYVEYIKDRNENARKESIYTRAKSVMENAMTGDGFNEAAKQFESIADYKDSEALAKECYEKEKDFLYSRIKSAMEHAKSVNDYRHYAQQFESIADYKDCARLAKECYKKAEELHIAEEEHMAEMKRQAEITRQLTEARARKRKRITGVSAAIIAVAVASAILWFTVVSPMLNYNSALELMENGSYSEAIVAFEAMDGYKDSAEKIDECNYLIAETFVTNGEQFKAAKAFYDLRNYKDAKERSFMVWNEIAKKHSYSTISAGGYHTVGLKNDGTVVAVGRNTEGQCDVSGWTDIVAISAGNEHTVGLKSDGTVVATKYTGSYYRSRCDVSGWTDIIAISAGKHHTVGLKADGTVVATKCIGSDVSGWTDIVAISAGNDYTVGLKADGTVVAVGCNNMGQCNVSKWTDIIAISAGGEHTLGLKTDGTVVAVGSNSLGQCRVHEWTDVMAISANNYHTIGLKVDGTVMTNGYTGVLEWTDIVAISAGYYHYVGLKADGTVVAVGSGGDVSGWTDIRLPE